MEEPGAMGDWTFKDVASHVTTWRRRTIDRLEAAARGDPMPPLPWPPELGEDEDDPINAWIHERTKDRPLDDVLADVSRSCDELVAAIESLPPGDVTARGRFPWVGGASLADADFGGHLDAHEPDVRKWLAGG